MTLKVYNLNEKFTVPVHLPKHATVNSQHIPRPYANMIPSTGVTQEIVENINPYDTMTPIDIMKVINGTALDRLGDSIDTNHEAHADSEITRAIILTVRSHQFVFSLDIDAQGGKLIYAY